MADEHVISRREFIKVTSIIGSGFAIGFNSLVGSKYQASNFSPDTFVNVLSDDTIILSVSKAEMGQGVWTSLPMLIAEEMEASWDKVKVNQTSKDSFMGTGGSMSKKDYGWKKKRKSSFAIPEVRESASHQHLLDLMSSNGRLKFYVHQARDAFKIAGEGMSWSILHDKNFMKYLSFAIFQCYFEN